ncbi:uncharacterized protein LOC108597582 [Drosophila busckii]|uniref:uncharacterized protein LOC108597582 n=1 Tax=Drosophila busckii TaxID=30019 RepID=UPI00083F253C|nr:uncharacterized protein LOC108597582 [Drosophila busckii]
MKKDQETQDNLPKPKRSKVKPKDEEATPAAPAGAAADEEEEDERPSVSRPVHLTPTVIVVNETQSAETKERNSLKKASRQSVLQENRAEKRPSSLKKEASRFSILQENRSTASIESSASRKKKKLVIVEVESDSDQESNPSNTNNRNTLSDRFSASPLMVPDERFSDGVCTHSPLMLPFC